MMQNKPNSNSPGQEHQTQQVQNIALQHKRPTTAAYDDRTKTMMAQKNHQKNLRRESLKPRSKTATAILLYFSHTIDLIFAAIMFFIIVTAVIRYNPELYDLSLQHHWLVFIFSRAMLIYTSVCVICSFLLYKTNRKFPGGSIGERVLKVGK
jgi:hypothetical protein